MDNDYTTGADVRRIMDSDYRCPRCESLVDTRPDASTGTDGEYEEYE